MNLRRLLPVAACVLTIGILAFPHMLTWLTPASGEEALVEQLFDWVRENGGLVEGVKVAEVQELVGNETVAMWGMVAARDLAATTPIVGLPRRVVLWRGHPELGFPRRAAKTLQRWTDEDVLTAFLIKEFRAVAAGEPSFWAPYIKVLQTVEYTNPQVWSAEELAAASPDFQKLVQLHHKWYAKDFDRFRQFFDTYPELKVAGKDVEYAEYLNAYFTVRTRVFAHHRLGGGGGSFCDFAEACSTMQPVLDMLNHDYELYSFTTYVSLIVGSDMSSEALNGYGPKFKQRLEKAHEKTQFFAQVTRPVKAGEQVG